LLVLDILLELLEGVGVGSGAVGLEYCDVTGKTSAPFHPPNGLGIYPDRTDTMRLTSLSKV